MKFLHAHIIAVLASTLYTDENWHTVKKIRLWGEHAVADAGHAISSAFHGVSDAVENNPEFKHAKEFKNAVKAMVESVGEMHKAANSNLQKRGAIPINLDEFSAQLAQKVDGIIQQLVLEFSEPQPEDKTEQYKAAEKAVESALDKIEDAIVTIFGALGISELEAREMFGYVKPHIKHVVLVLYKLAEEHPIIVGTVIAIAVTLLLPEGFFLRPILQIFGWGTMGPVKGSPAAWIQRVFFPSSIPKRGWFSNLQRIGMAKL